MTQSHVQESARVLSPGEAFQLVEAALMLRDLVRDCQVPDHQGLAYVGAEGLSGTRSGRLEGGPLLRADADRDRRHLVAQDDHVRVAVAFAGDAAVVVPADGLDDTVLVRGLADEASTLAGGGVEDTRLIGHVTTVAQLSYGVKGWTGGSRER